MPFARLMGQETEYAVRFSPQTRHPGNDTIYDCLARAIRRQVRTEPGLYLEPTRFFTQNGGAFYYECLPYCTEGGLVEGATPECTGPIQLLLYQKAQEAILLDAIPAAERELSRLGFPGKIGLLKNCRDAEGHIYGAQESFECEIARGPGLVLYRSSLVAILPVLLLTLLVGWILAAVIALGGAMVAVLATVLASAPPLENREWLQQLTEFEGRRFQNVLGRFLYWVMLAVMSPVVLLLAGFLWMFAFRRTRRDVLSFLVSRPVLSGAGSVRDDEHFSLAEKASAIVSQMRFSIRPDDRAIFDISNLSKATLIAAFFHFRPLLRLFRRRQRLQLGLADSCMLEEAEFLKIGTTALVIDMAEAGYLRDAPRPVTPIAALHAIVADPSLEATVATNRGELTALELQRFYLDKAKAYLVNAKATSMEAAEVVKLWEDVLAAFDRREMPALVGRVDWVTKRYLLEACGGGEDAALLKTIDLRYHELGDGYAARFARSGNARRLVSPDEVDRAIHEPPEGSPAYARGRFIRFRAPTLPPVRISWTSALVGGRLRGKLVRFPDRDV